ncbi:MAG: hypothetical protein ABW184_03125 [Sphingobium sp.]
MMTEIELCHDQIARLDALINQEPLENVRAKYVRSISVWKARSMSAERMRAGRDGR